MDNVKDTCLEDELFLFISPTILSSAKPKNIEENCAEGMNDKLHQLSLVSQKKNYIRK